VGADTGGGGLIQQSTNPLPPRGVLFIGAGGGGQDIQGDGWVRILEGGA